MLCTLRKLITPTETREMGLHQLNRSLSYMVLRYVAFVYLRVVMVGEDRDRDNEREREIEREGEGEGERETERVKERKWVGRVCGRL